MQCVTLSPRSRLSHPLPLCAGKTADVLTRTRPPNNPTARRGPLCRTAVVRAPRGTSSHAAIRSLDAGPEQNERTNARTQTWSRSRGSPCACCVAPSAPPRQRRRRGRAPAQCKPLDGWCSQLITLRSSLVQPSGRKHRSGGLQIPRLHLASWSQHLPIYHPIEYRSITVSVLQRRELN
jgi:hypothetical protein